MIKKLFNKLASLFRTPKVAPKELIEPPTVQLNLDTGKLIIPENLTEAEKVEVSTHINELKESLQQLNKDAFQSLEQFLSEYGKTGNGISMPFTTANGLPDAQLQVLEEIENCKEDTEHWSDEDFLEALLGYYNGGYSFQGIEHLHGKLNDNLELTLSEKRQIREWYMLATQELVYDV